MTITYSDREPLRSLRLLLRWRGSVWKAIWREALLFLIAYFALNIGYRAGMDEEQRKTFEKLVKMFQQWHTIIPLTFLIGFYVSTVFSRWWEQLNYIAWPDKLLLFLTANIQGSDKEALLIRRTMARYCNLLTVLVWKEVSLKVKKRFPSDTHVLKAGLMTEAEYRLYTTATGTYGRWFIPVSWMVNLAAKCKADGRLTDRAFQKIIEEIWAFRTNSAMLTIYDWINIPLVYTQVVTLATYGYFALAILSRQSLQTDEVDVVFPVFTCLEFIFYVGWMKVGTELRIRRYFSCPFGEDDEDFSMNFVLDRNIQVAITLVDELERHRPELAEDKFFSTLKPKVPHTKGSSQKKDGIPDWRLHNVKINAEEMEEHDSEEEEKKKEGNGLRKRNNDVEKASKDIERATLATAENIQLTESI